MPEYRILVVEDSPITRQLISFALRELKSVKIIEASDGIDGLKKLSSDSVNLIITDINMPEMDGFKFVGLIRKNDAYRNIPIIVITIATSKEDKEKALALGANAYIKKPIGAHQILGLVRGFLFAGGPQKQIGRSPYSNQLALGTR